MYSYEDRKNIVKSKNVLEKDTDNSEVVSIALRNMCIMLENIHDDVVFTIDTKGEIAMESL